MTHLRSHWIPVIKKLKFSFCGLTYEHMKQCLPVCFAQKSTRLVRKLPNSLSAVVWTLGCALSSVPLDFGSWAQPGVRQLGERRKSGLTQGVQCLVPSSPECHGLLFSLHLTEGILLLTQMLTTDLLLPWKHLLAYV